MTQLILHLIGDYLIQNDWMALNKKRTGIKGMLACQVHCITYAVPFLLIANIWQVFFIYVGHYMIDRWNFVTWFLSKRNSCGMDNFGYGGNRPSFIAFWLNVITDNSFHLIINSAILADTLILK